MLKSSRMGLLGAGFLLQAKKKSQEVIIQYTVNSQYLKALHFENFCQEMREGGFLWLFFVLTFENYFGEFLPGVPGSGLLVWW